MIVVILLVALGAWGVLDVLIGVLYLLLGAAGMLASREEEP